MPFNIAAGNSSGYNYASGRLDHQTYFKSIRVDQAHIGAVVLDRILAAWFDEAALLPGMLPTGVGPIADWPHHWFWDGHEHVDPAKEANAQARRENDAFIIVLCFINACAFGRVPLFRVTLFASEARERLDTMESIME